MLSETVVRVIMGTGILIGFNFLFWSAICMARFVTSVLGLIKNSPELSSFHPVARWSLGQPLPLQPAEASAPPYRVNLTDVAVIVPARNEEDALPLCLAALTRVIPASQIFVASDGSADATVRIAANFGCNVTDIQPNGGKAKAIQRIIAEDSLCQRFKAVLILDADSKIDERYFCAALPLFDDPDVVTVAGHQLSIWRPDWFPDSRALRRILTLHGTTAQAAEMLTGLRKLLYTAYRVRLFRVMQGVYQYGQSWRPLSVSYIAPGAASMYRTSALSAIDIAAPNLVIEDFNMTFEVQHKGLGRIAYTPRAMCASEDPFTFRDYRKQIKRWHLGFWQTVWRHGFWPSKFSVSLAFFAAEILAFSLFLLVLPIAVLLHMFYGTAIYTLSAYPLSVKEITPVHLLIAYFAIDVSTTMVVAIYERRPHILLFAPVFPFLRLVDAAYYLYGFALSFTSRSNGTWTSPSRQLKRTDASCSLEASK